MARFFFREALAFGWYAANGRVAHKAPTRSDSVFLSGFAKQDVTCLSWWTPHEDRQHLVELTDSKRRSTFSNECPLVFVGSSAVNMKQTVSTVSIAGDIQILDTSEVVMSHRISPIGLCALAGACLGSLLAVSEGDGRITLFNQDASLLRTAVTSDLDVACAATHLAFMKEREQYRLAAICRDEKLRVYDIPWNIAHCRNEHPPTLIKHSVTQDLPADFVEAGGIQGAFGKVLLLDYSRKHLLLMGVGSPNQYVNRKYDSPVLHTNIQRTILDVLLKSGQREMIYLKQKN